MMTPAAVARLNFDKRTFRELRSRRQASKTLPSRLLLHHSLRQISTCRFVQADKRKDHLRLRDGSSYGFRMRPRQKIAASARPKPLTPRIGLWEKKEREATMPVIRATKIAAPTPCFIANFAPSKVETSGHKKFGFVVKESPRCRCGRRSAWNNALRS
jgi:hypothetical protein